MIETTLVWPTARPPEATVGEAQGALAAGEALLIDVRDARDWRAGHVEGALHIPLVQLPARLHALPRDRALLLLGDSGYRSGVASILLRLHGFEHATKVAGGMNAWLRHGLPIIRGA